MATNKFPRVVVGTKVVTRDLPRTVDEGRTTLYMPIVSEKGPTNEITKIYNYSELVHVFGELDYEIMGQGKLNLIQWLTNGGYAYVVRLESDTMVSENDQLNSGELIIKSKYAGSYYHGLVVRFKDKLVGKDDQQNDIYTYDVTIIKDRNPVEIFRSLKPSEIITKVNELSKFIKFEGDAGNVFPDSAPFNGEEDDQNDMIYDYTLSIDDIEEQTLTPETFIEAAQAIVNGGNEDLYGKLSDRENYPIDVILSDNISVIETGVWLTNYKKALITFVQDVRPDISLILDVLDSTNILPGDPIGIDNHYSIAVTHPDQKSIVFDASVMKDISVGATYHYAALIPRNDRDFGMHFPIAGTRRANLTNVKRLVEPLTELEKNLAIDNRFNYIDQDSRGYRLFSNMNFMVVGDGTYNSLAYFNNSRVLNRIIRDIRVLGKQYLFEYNDTTTLVNMRNELNRYVSQWVQNRALELAELDIYKDNLLDDVVHVNLSVKFTGIIEVINVNIVVQ